MNERDADQAIDLSELEQVVEQATTLDELQRLKVRIDAAATALRAAVVE